MCGICGIFITDPAKRVSETALAEMNRRIVHRGPDDDGFFLEGNVGLAMRRLSIIDVRTGHQPICNEDESLWIVYNGEIYNHQELRGELEGRGHRYRTRSDTETILHLYEEYGPNCVKRLRGMFAFAIWDRRARKLFLARDRLGIKPLYYLHNGDALLFGSEIKAILAYPGSGPQFNLNALGEYLAFGYITGAETMYAGVKKLLPGTVMEVDEKGEIRIDSYWDLEVPSEVPPQPRKYYVSRYRELLEECVASHLMSDVPLGVFLSGGLDSSAVAALMSRIRREPVETFSVGYGEEAFSELSHARCVAQHIGSRHHEVKLSSKEFFQSLPKLIWHEDEPIAWPSSVALYFVARLAREHVTVVLTGEGSDETLGGYTRYAWTLHNAAMDRLYRRVAPAGLRTAIRHAVQNVPWGATLHRKLDHTFLARDGESWPSFYFDNFYSGFSAAEQAGILTPETLALTGNPYEGSLHFWGNSSGDLLHRLLYTDIKSYLVELLMKQDQMSMAASLESRVPFLDHVLVEFTATIPSACLTRGMTGKLVLKSAVEDLLPRAIVYRQKMGFPTPWAHWLRGPQVAEVERMLLEPRSLERGLFKPDAVRRLFDEHRKGRRDYGNHIWRLLNLETWFRVCIDQDSRLREAGEPPVFAAAGASTLHH